MRVLIQRVKSASVAVGGENVAGIGPGLLLFVGIGTGDGEADLDWMTRKIAALRVFPDAAGKMNLDVAQANGEILSVSQFTLYADVSKGTRPGFDAAERPAAARAMWETFNVRLSGLGLPVKTGVFAADMQVSIVNDGPVTIWMESRK